MIFFFKSWALKKLIIMYTNTDKTKILKVYIYWVNYKLAEHVNILFFVVGIIFLMVFFWSSKEVAWCRYIHCPVCCFEVSETKEV